MADMAVKNPDDALDIVQDAMLTLAKKYADKPAEQWPPLFYRILQNRIRDWHRRGKVRNRVFSWLGGGKAESSSEIEPDPIAMAAGPAHLEPEQHQRLGQMTQELEVALAGLPERQRQAFMLRVWQGLGVAQTAQAMGCSGGSVKTHYSRAVHKLRKQLEQHWHE
jgi:RNA polymerase sigma-70 factor (ECF subfamily)